MVSRLRERYRVATVILCPVSLALMGLCIKLSEGIAVAVLLLARFGISAIFFAIYLVWQRYDFARIEPRQHILRTVLGFASVACLFGAIARIPLSTALCLSYTVPIFSYLLSLIEGSARLDGRSVFIVSAVLSIFLIAAPSETGNLTGAVLAIASAFFGACSLFEIKRLSDRQDSQSILIMYFTYSTLALLLFLMAFEPASVQFDFSPRTTWLLLVGVFGLLYQMTLVGSLRWVSVPSVSLVLLTSVAVGYLLDVFALGTQFTTQSLSGMAILAISLALYQSSPTAHRKASG